MKPEELKEFLGLGNISPGLLKSAMQEANLYLVNYGIDPDSDDANIASAMKYLSAYFLLPQLSAIVGSHGMTKEIGMGEQAQHLISEADMERKQQFYYQHAMRIIENITNADFPFGIDI